MHAKRRHPLRQPRHEELMILFSTRCERQALAGHSTVADE
jgi:hypothetical protein